MGKTKYIFKVTQSYRVNQMNHAIFKLLIMVSLIIFSSNVVIAKDGEKRPRDIYE